MKDKARVRMDSRFTALKSIFCQCSRGVAYGLLTYFKA